MKFVYALFGFTLKFLSRGCKISVLVSEQLIGYLACQQYADIRLLVD